MKYGEIKIEALKLMFAGTDDLDVDALDKYAQDEVYRYYLVNMPGSINRCFSCIEEKRVLPSKSRALRRSEGVANGGYIRFDLSSIIKDFFDIDRIVYEADNGEYNGDCDYTREGDTIVLNRYEEDDGITYIVIYNPKIERVSSITEDTKEIQIPDSIAAHIPYFIKGDLYREDEPNEASEARNWFEQAMAEIQNKRISRISAVKSVYSQTE